MALDGTHAGGSTPHTLWESIADTLGESLPAPAYDSLPEPAYDGTDDGRRERRGATVAILNPEP